MGKITKKFDNGNVNIELDNGQLIKLPSGLVDDLMGLIKGRVRGYDAIRVWIGYWKNERVFIVGPDGEAKKTWSERPTWEHRPFVDIVGFIEILEALHGKDLSAYRDFIAGERDLFRTSRVYTDWMRQQQSLSGVIADRNRTCTTLISEDEFQKMRERLQGDG